MRLLKLKSIRILLFLFLFCLLIFLFLAGLLVWSGLNDQLGKADVALVLGSKVNSDGEPSSRLKARLDEAADQYRKGYYPKIIVSGGTGIEGVPEGTAMKNYLVSAGIPSSAILVDDLGINTHASAVNTASIMKDQQMKTVFVVTQYFHIPRSKLALSKLGIEPIFHSHARYFEIRDIYSTAREIPAYFTYLSRG